MSISQSRANSRGPLIAVIKIEIYNDQVDRIFLHQNDDDYKLAQQFQQKHRLNSVFVEHIYHKIKASRESLQKDIFSKSPVDACTQRSNINNYENNMTTPYEHRKQDTYRRNGDSTTPFQKIGRYEPLQQQNSSYPVFQQNSKIPNAELESTESGNRYNSKRSNYGNIVPRISRQNRNSNATPFQTFMNVQNAQSTRNKQFANYIQQKRQQLNAQEIQNKLIEKDKTIPNFNFQSVQDSWYQKQVRPQSLETTKTFDYRQERNKSKKANCSFNQDKPQRVKVLKKSEMQSMQSSQKSLSKLEKTKIVNKVTSRLYNESEIKKNYLNKIKERAKIQKEDKQDKELTYRPQINKVSQIIAADRYKNVPVQEYLVRKAKDTEIKIEAERALRFQRQLQNCSFQPKVNIISQKLARDPGKMQRDSSCRALQQCSRNYSKSQVGFRPTLNKMSEQIVKMKGQGNFDQRLKQFLEQKNNKLKQMTQEKKIKQKLDQLGQPLFRPRILSKARGRSPKGKEVYDYLYQLSKVQKKIQVQVQKPKISEHSQQIIEQMYIKRIAWLFSQLDSDQDGFISPKRICIDTISQSILEVIIPVLFQMEEMDIELNLQDFRNAIKNLHSSLNSHQKSILYSYNKAPYLQNSRK